MNLLDRLLMYGLMLQQKFIELSFLDVVAEDSEIIDQLKAFKEPDIGLFMVEPEMTKEGSQDHSMDVVYIQMILAKKLSDRVSLKEKIRIKNQLCNLITDLDITIQNHKEDSGDFLYQFSLTDDLLPDYDVACELMHKLDIQSIQKVPVSMSKIYIGWSLTFKIKLL